MINIHSLELHVGKYYTMITVPEGAIEHIRNLSEVAAALTKIGDEMRFVGGCVRGWLHGETPKDIDLHIKSTPEVAMALYSALGIDFYTTGLQHGTITLRINGVSYEVTSCRRDVATDGRHAQVEYTTDWMADLARRDLTINSMSLGFNGELLDPYQGRKDLKAGHVRFVGEAFDRIREDYLRILRFFRFLGRYAEFDFNAAPLIDEHQSYCLSYLADGLKQISRERVLMELLGIFKGDHADEILELMGDLGISKAIGLPTARLKNLRIAMAATDDPIIRLAAYMDEVSKIGQEHPFIRDLPLSKDDRRTITYLTASINGPKPLIEYQRRIFVDQESRDMVRAYALMMGQADEADCLEDWEIPKLPINGNDVKPFAKRPTDFPIILGHVRHMFFQSDYKLTAGECMAIVAQCSMLNA